MSSFQQASKEFLKNVSTHGLQRIFIPITSQPPSRFFRWIWLIVWLSAAVLMLKQISAVIQDYLQYKTVTRFSVEERNSVAFPEVTLCHQNGLRKQKVEKWLENCDEILDGKLFHICKNARDQRRNTMERDLVKLGLELDYNLSRHDSKLAKNLSASWNELLLESNNKFNDDINFDMEKAWRFKFHWKSGHDMEVPGFSCFSFNSDNDRWQTKANIDGGLFVRLKKNGNKSHCFGECDGIYYVILHAPGTIPILNSGNMIKIDKSRDILYHYEERVLQEPPYGNCKSSNSMPREIIRWYPSSEKFNYSLSACFGLKYDGIFPMMAAENVTDQDGIESVQCFPECFQRLYKYDVRDRMYSNIDDEIGLSIYNLRLETTRIEEVAAVTFEQVVGNAGGLLGLWLGASMLTLLEVCEFLSNVIFCCLSSIKMFSSTSTTASARQATET